MTDASRGLNRAPMHVVSQRAAVLNAFLAAIEDERLMPGQRVHVSRTSAELDVAIGTVREAVGALARMRLVEGAYSRHARIVTPTGKWFAALVAESMGVAMFAADAGIAHATDADRDVFARASAATRELWASAFVDPVVGNVAVWEIIHLLAGFSRNDDLVRLHAEKRHALRLGIRHLMVPQNPAMMTRALKDLDAAVQKGDRAEGADIVRDLYSLAATPFLTA